MVWALFLKRHCTEEQKQIVLCEIDTYKMITMSTSCIIWNAEADNECSFKKALTPPRRRRNNTIAQLMGGNVISSQLLPYREFFRSIIYFHKFLHQTLVLDKKLGNWRNYNQVLYILGTLQETINPIVYHYEKKFTKLV